MEKSKWHVHDYFDGEQQLQYFHMQYLTSAIEEIASGVLADSHTSKNIDVSEPTLENLQSSPETNDSAKHGLSDAADEMATIDSMPSQSYAPAMEFSEERDGAQVAFTSPPQNKGEKVGRSCSSEEVSDEALELAKEVAVGSENILSVSREKQRRTGSGDGTSEGSCSRSKRKSPYEIISKFRKRALYRKEPQAVMLPSSVIVNRREQSENAGGEEGSSDQTSSAAQVNEQPNINADSLTSTQILTQVQNCDLISQNATHPYQPSNGGTCSAGIGLSSPEASNVQPTNQTTTRSMVDQCMPEIRLQADPITSELTQALRSCIHHAPSFAQATGQRNDDARSSLSTQRETQQQFFDQIRQTVAHQYQPSGGSTSSVRTWANSSGESSVQQQLAFLPTAGSTSMNERGLPSNPLMIELCHLLMLRDLMTKRHQFEKQKIILEREMAVAEVKRKYDELFHNLEMETLQKKKDVEILQVKACKQQTLAEAFQVMCQASAGVASYNERDPVSGAPSRTTEVSNQSLSHQILRIPASTTMAQPQQPAAQSSTNHILRQPSMITQEGTTNTSGRFTASLAPAPGVVMGTGIANHAPAPHLRAFLTSLPASRRDAAALRM